MSVWTTPTTRSTGLLVTAAIWNTDIVENLKYLKDSPVFDGSPVVDGPALGIGVTPSGWGTSNDLGAVQITGGALWATGSSQISVGQNYYYNGMLTLYRTSAAASEYKQSGGVHTWSTASSGTAGNVFSFTERMRLDASGNLGIGVTPNAGWESSWRALQLVGAGALSGISGLNAVYLTSNTYFLNDQTAKYIATDFATQYQQYNGEHRWSSAPSGTAGNAITFTRRMTLDASGNFYVGTTSQSGGSNITFNQPTNADMKIAALASTGTRAAYQVFVSNTVTTVGTENSTGGSLASGTAAYATVLANNGAYPIGFATNNTERMRIDSSGNVGIGMTPTYRLDITGGAGSVVARFNQATAGKTGVIFAENGTQRAFLSQVGLYSGNSDGNFGIFVETGYNFQIATNGSITSKFTVHTGGNIAIGATARLYLDGVAGTGNTYISEESGDVIALTAGGTVGLRVNTQGVNTVTGSQSVNSGVATTLFSVTTKGLYEVFAYYGGASAIYLSAARVMSDGAGFYRATFDNGAGLTLSLSGSNVQATQSSGGALTIQYRFLRISD